MESFFLNTGYGRIYVAMHEPHHSFSKDTGIIICPPIGQEHIRTYRSLYILADKLSRNNFPTIRFDPFGCGDSDGDFIEASIDIWVSGIKDVVQEFQSLFTLKQLVFLGVRLGATFLNKFLEGQDMVSNYGQVLWCPVIQGSEYLDEIAMEHKKWFLGSFATRRKSKKTEFLGFDYSEKLMGDISRLTFVPAKRKKGLVLERGNKLLHKNFKEMEAIEVYEDRFWIKGENDVNKALIPVKDINNIVNWIENNYA